MIQADSIKPLPTDIDFAFEGAYVNNEATWIKILSIFLRSRC